MEPTNSNAPALKTLFKGALLWLWTIVGGTLAVAAVPGDMPKLDLTWGTSGVSPVGVSYAQKVLLLPDGSSIFVGDACSQGSACIALRKLNASGGPDPVFRGGAPFVFSNAAYGVNYAINAFLCDANQNVLVVGRSNGKLFLAKISATTGEPASTFGTAGAVYHVIGAPGDDVTPLSAMMTKDKSALVVSATATSSTSVSLMPNFLVKISADLGVIDATFGNQGIVTTSTPIYALSPIAVDQKFVAGGSAGNSAALYQFSEMSGNLDTTFGTGGVASFQLGTTAIAGRTDRVVDIVELPNDFRLAVATIRTTPINVVLFTMFGNVVQLALFDRATNSIQSSFAAGAGFVEPANFTQTGLDIAAPHPRIVVNSRTRRIYLSANVDGYSPYAAFNLDGTPDIEFGNAGGLDAPQIYQMSPPSSPSPSWPIAVSVDTMTIGGSRPVRLRLATCDGDIDGDGHRTAMIDGTSLLGAMLALPIGSVRVGAARPTAKAQRDYASLLIGSNVLDIDGDGTVSAETDGLILMRKLLGFTGAALTEGIQIPPNALRRSAVDVENFLATACTLE